MNPADLDEFGHIEGVVVDFSGRWKNHFAKSEIVVAEIDLSMDPITRGLAAGET